MSSSSIEEDSIALKSYVKSYPDFPLPGILFRDIFNVFQNTDGLQLLNNILKKYANEVAGKVDCVAMLEARGFLLGTLMALYLNVPCVPVRKKGKLPGKVAQLEYSLEYAKDVLEVQLDVLKEGTRVLVIDDLLATGGTLQAAVQLLKKTGAEVVQAVVIMELCDLEGRKKVDIPTHVYTRKTLAPLIAYTREDFIRKCIHVPKQTVKAEQQTKKEAMQLHIKGDQTSTKS